MLKLATAPPHDGSNNIHALLHRICRYDFQRQPFDSLLCMVEIQRWLVLLAKEETVLQDVIDRIIEVGISCGIEVNVVKSKVKLFSGQPSPAQVVRDKKQLENVENFSLLKTKWYHNPEDYSLTYGGCLKESYENIWT